MLIFSNPKNNHFRDIYPLSGSVKCCVKHKDCRNKLGLVGVQEIRWDKEGTVRAGDYNFFYGKRNENHQLRT
jgi:hypothetical protein